MDTSTINTIVNLFTIVLTIAPMVITIIRFVGVKTNSKQVITLADRAAIIVSALDRVDMEKVLKKETAIAKLLEFAKETKIDLTSDQAEDYIEDAVTRARLYAYGKEQ